MKLWVNGKAEYITDGKKNAQATSVFVHNDTVYIVGCETNDFERDVSKLWINGVAKNLTDGTKNAYARSIFVKYKENIKKLKRNFERFRIDKPIK